MPNDTPQDEAKFNETLKRMLSSPPAPHLPTPKREKAVPPDGVTDSGEAPADYLAPLR